MLVRAGAGVPCRIGSGWPGGAGGGTAVRAGIPPWCSGKAARAGLLRGARGRRSGGVRREAGGRINQRAVDQFAQTVRVCAAVGWRHEVLCGPNRVRAGNLAFVRPARLTRAHPDEASCARLLDIFKSGRPIGQGAQVAGGVHRALVMPAIKHLIWHRRLRVDLDQRLDFATVATSRPGSTPCCG